MSRHWVDISTNVIDSSMADIAEAIRRLQKLDPELAVRAANANWIELRKKIALQVMQDVAKEKGGEVRSTYRNEAGGYTGNDAARMTKGENLGVIAVGKVQLGITYDHATGTISSYANGYSREAGARAIEAKFTKRFRRLQAEAALAFAVGETESREVEGGFVVGANLPKAKQS